MAKRILDIACAICALILFSPLFLIIAIAIKATSSGPVFFIQDRLGKDCGVFRMFKFRTMVENAEKMGTGLFSYADDDRITKVGHILRKSSLDELPQFINVFLGTMSIVGPRPPVTYELGNIEDFTPEMKIRFKVKPGITGLAQISGRNDLDWDQKIKHDNLYVEKFQKWGALYDLGILFKTVWVVLSFKNTIEERKS